MWEMRCSQARSAAADFAATLTRLIAAQIQMQTGVDPGFSVEFGFVDPCMRLSLRKGAHVGGSGAAW
jgi:hypothetical protein